MDGQAVAGRLAQAHVARNDRREHLALEVLLHLGDDLQAQVGARVEHREHDALNLQAAIERLLHARDRTHQRGDALQRVVFALNRDEHAVGSAQGVDRDQAQGGRTVDEHVIEPVANGGQRLAQRVFAVLGARQLQLRAGQADVRGQQRQAFDPRVRERLPGRARARKHLVDRAGVRLHAHAQSAAGVALRVRVHDEHALALRGHAGAEVDARGRLAHAALLIRDGDDLTHMLPRSVVDVRILYYTEKRPAGQESVLCAGRDKPPRTCRGGLLSPRRRATIRTARDRSSPRSGGGSARGPCRWRTRQSPGTAA